MTKETLFNRPGYFEPGLIDPIFYYVALCVVKFFLVILDRLMERLCGLSLVSGSLKERAKAKAEGRTMQVVKILARAQYEFSNIHGLDNFLYRHESYQKPEMVLEHSNIAFFGMRDDKAFFCWSDVDPYDTERIPFFTHTMIFTAKKLLILSLDDLVSLANRIGDPSVPVAVFQMTGRSGSTLLCQMFFEIPNTRVLSNAAGFTYAKYALNRGQLSMARFTELIAAMFRVYCKVEPGSGVKQIVLKTNTWCSQEAVLIKQLFPQVKLAFSTRHPLSCIKSHLQKLGKRRFDHLYNHLPWAWQRHLNIQTFRNDDNHEER